MAENWHITFARDATLFPHLFDVHTDRVMLSRLTEQDYRNASFLDQRIITDNGSGQWVPWEELAFVDGSSNPAPQFIFHVGHVGSTLLSRLLGEIPSVFALREPPLLRNLAEIGKTIKRIDAHWSLPQYSERLLQSLGWLSRRFNKDQTAIIKASSFVSEIAGDMIGEKRPCLFIFASLERYLETILAGESSLREMHVLSSARILRLQARLTGFDVPLWQMSLTQKIAMSWLCEMTALTHAANSSAGEVMWLDFDTFLRSPEEKLQRVAHHFCHDLNEYEAKALICGPIMSSYSKAPEHRYSPDLRRQLLEQAGSNHREQIYSALTWVKELATMYPQVAQAMEMTDGVE